MSTFVIGDIHGCLDQLDTLITYLRRSIFDPGKDALIFMGDYVDRGPDSSGVLDYCIRLKEECDCTFLMGNHEDMMLQHMGLPGATAQGGPQNTMNSCSVLCIIWS